MIVYTDVFKRLSEHGWSTYRLAKEKVIGSGTMQRINAGLSVSTETIEKICALCDCQPGDLIRYVPDEREG